MTRLALLLFTLSACTTSDVPVRPGADAGWGDPDDEFGPDAALCLAQSVEGEQAKLPVDIIWVVDTSGSMSFEATAVETNLNAFAAQIDSWDVDYRVVMVAKLGDGGNEVCVPPPLGGPGCTDGPLYRHVPQRVGSTNALERLIETYPLYQDFLREETLKYFVVVTDDEADNDTDDVWFRAAIAGLTAPGFPPRDVMPEGYVFHSIVAWGDVPNRGCDTGADIGQSYLNLTELTGGVKAKVCETDWNPIFLALQTAILDGSALPCVFDIPPPPQGETLDPNRVNVIYTPVGGAPITLSRVDSAGACADNLGWYYDDPAVPTQIVMCPAVCELFGDGGDGNVDFQFGCDSVVVL